MSSPDSFLNLNTPIRNTHCYKKALCLSVITDIFVKKYINKFSRTTDQMIQAVRSVKQNIIEGAIDGATSKETELKLFNIARGSLHELLEDFKDFLIFNGLSQWQSPDPRLKRTREKLRYEENPDWYATLPGSCSEETCANIIITLIYQVDSLVRGLLAKSEKEFLEKGGLREAMYRSRVSVRDHYKSTLRQNTRPTDNPNKPNSNQP